LLLVCVLQGKWRPHGATWGTIYINTGNYSGIRRLRTQEVNFRMAH